MANEIFDKIPAWVKSLWDMENELRHAARKGIILRTDEASAHLSEARRHLDKAINDTKSSITQTPSHGDGDH